MPPETVMLRPHAVRALLRAQSFDETDNSIEVVWTTGATVQRFDWCDGPYTETLDLGPKAVRLDRMNGGVPFLNAHGSWDLADVIGRTVPGSAKIAGGEGTCRVALSVDPDKAGIVGDTRSKDPSWTAGVPCRAEGEVADTFRPRSRTGPSIG